MASSTKTAESNDSSSKMILILGGTGRSGKAVVKRALYLGMKVRLYVRDSDKARSMFLASNQNDKKIEIMQGELDNTERLQEALLGVDGVVSALASFFPPHTQMSTAIMQIARYATMQRNEHQPQSSKRLRVIHYGLCGLQNPDTDYKYRQTFISWFAPFNTYKIAEAMQDHRRVLRILNDDETVLNATVFMTPSVDYDKPLGNYQAGPPEQVPMKIWNKVGALDIADACLKRLDDEDCPTFLNLNYE